MGYDNLFDHIRNVNLEMERHFYRLFSPQHPLQSLPEEKWQPYTDVYEAEDAFVIKLELAGVKKEDLSVNLWQNRLTIRGIRRDSPPNEKRIYHQVEINYNEFERVVILPETMNEDAIKAEFNDGFLVIMISKEQTHVEEKTLEIEIE